MGEDFLRNRNDRSKRQREEGLNAHLGPDLFSAFPPETTILVQGMVMIDGHLEPNSEIWSPPLAAEGPIQFYHGDMPVVEVTGASAEHIRNECGVGGPAVVGQVMDVNGEDGLARIRVLGTVLPL